MRNRFLWFLLPFFFAPLILAADIEYGHIQELQGVQRVNVWTDKDDELRAAIQRHLQTDIPQLTIVETEKEAQIVFAVKRRAAKEDSPDPNLRFVTTGSVIRPLNATRIRLITDLVSTKENFIEATNEVTDSFTNLLKSQNAKRYGKPEAMKQEKRQFRSMAGLRPGLSKREVIAAVGAPTRVERKETMSPVWFYETTDGTFRLIFQGDALMNAQLIPAKK